MSVTFSPATTPIGWRLSCAWDDRVFASHADALPARAAHQDGGCDAAIEWDASVSGLSGPAWVEASDAVRDRTGRWADSCMSAVFVEAVYAEDGPELNMSQSNASDVLEALGLVEETPAVESALEAAPSDLGGILASMCPTHICWSGSISPEDLRGRVMMASALVEDIGTASYDYRLRGADDQPGARVIVSGRPAGQLSSYFERLLTIADWAESRQVNISWS